MVAGLIEFWDNEGFQFPRFLELGEALLLETKEQCKQVVHAFLLYTMTGMVVCSKDKVVNLGYLANLLHLRGAFQFGWG